MENTDVNEFLTVLQEKYPNVLNRNKRFWKIDFAKEMESFLSKSRKTFTMQEETDPHKVDRCPNCHVTVIPGDNYCPSCGSVFQWT